MRCVNGTENQEGSWTSQEVTWRDWRGDAGMDLSEGDVA
jgi:hypothetical protein